MATASTRRCRFVGSASSPRVLSSQMRTPDVLFSVVGGVWARPGCPPCSQALRKRAFRCPQLRQLRRHLGGLDRCRIARVGDRAGLAARPNAGTAGDNRGVRRLHSHRGRRRHRMRLRPRRPSPQGAWPGSHCARASRRKLARRLVLGRVPQGRRSLAQLRREIERTGASWDGRLRISAVELNSGNRVIFDGSGEPEATVGQAVEASCSIPACFARWCSTVPAT